MPELPEVETIASDLRTRILNLRIEKITVHDQRMLKGIPPETFIAFLLGRTIGAITRRGKAIIITLDNGRFFVVQVMMTGQLIYTKDAPASATKITFQLSNGYYLHYNDVRLFGRLEIVEDWRTLKYFQNIGPEPLEIDFSPNWLAAELKKRRTPIKPLLMDHRFVAGIGNIYASEILYRSGIHPRRRANTINRLEASVLHKATVVILKAAVKYRGTSMNNYRDSAGQKGNFINRIRVYGRDNEECTRCRSLLKRIVQGGRSTFFCPGCQPARRTCAAQQKKIHEKTYSY